MKTSVMGDPAWGGAISNLTSLFDPKVAAEGAALRARTKNFEAEAAYNAARTGLLTDRRAALSTDALLKAGYTPRQIAAWQATQTDSMADAFKGVQTDTGTQMIVDGQRPIAGAILAGANPEQVTQALLTSRLVGLGPQDNFNAPLAAAIAGGTPNVGGNLGVLTPQGWTLGPATEQGKVYQGTAANNANESAATVGLTKAKTQAVESLGSAKVETEEERRARIAAAIQNDSALADAVVGLQGARTNRVVAGQANDKTRTDAAVDATKARADAAVDATKTKAAGAAAGNALDNANKQGSVRQKIDRVLENAYAKRTNNGKAWALLDAEQKRSIVDYATQYASDPANGGDIVAGIAEAEKAHNVTGGATEGVNKGWFTDSGNGVMSLNGFKPAQYQRKSASPVADAVAPAAPANAPATNAPAAEGVEPMPTEKAKLVVGKSYNTPKGVLKWTGEKFVTP